MMKKPDLSKICETFLKIDVPNHAELYAFIRSDLAPVLLDLKEKGLINWYSFLIHDKKSGGIPTTDEKSAFFHIRLELGEGIDLEKLNLPRNFEFTRRVSSESLQSCSDINKNLLKNEDIAEAWRILGEISELVIAMLNAHKEDAEIPPQQIAQFLHFLANITQVKIQ